MTSSSSNRFRPFKNLKSQIKLSSRKREELRPAPATQSRSTDTSEHALPKSSEELTFQDIVQDITPLTHNKITRPIGLLRPKSPHQPNQSKTHRHLKNSIRKGLHFSFTNIPQFLDATFHDIFSETTNFPDGDKLSIQAYVDLHGLDRDQAKVVFDNFLYESINFDQRMLLIIHGRGISSPGKPVLKTLVNEWLTRGPWRKWILSFGRANPVDGGSGATYVQLRRKTKTKSQRSGAGIYTL
nr:Smr/MutS family protein [Desulfobulbaceae bacterium]